MSGRIVVHVIGPRYGEAVVLHLPDDDLVVVDSFGTRCDERSPVCEYLSAAFPDHKRLRAFALTHPHADHSFRASAVVRRYSPEEVWLYRPFPAEEGFRYFMAMRQYRCRERVEEALDLPAGTTALELLSLQQWVENEDRAGRVRVRYLASRAPFEMAGGRVRVQFLTPGDVEQYRYASEVGQAWAAIIRDGPSLAATGRLPQPDHNRASGALLVEFGVTRLLLMADAEEPLWAEWLETTSPGAGPVHFLKAAHHGSANGCHTPACQRLTDPEWTTAVVTPFRHGRVRLPSVEGIGRIEPLVRELYCTNAAAAIEASGRRFELVSPGQLPPVPPVWAADIARDRRLAGLLVASAGGDPGLWSSQAVVPRRWLQAIQNRPELRWLLRPELHVTIPRADRVADHVVVATYDDAGNRLDLQAGLGVGRLTPG